MRTLFLGPLLACLTACSDDGATTSPGTGLTGTTTATGSDPATTADPTTTTGVLEPTTSPTSDTSTSSTGDTPSGTSTSSTGDTTSPAQTSTDTGTADTSTTDTSTTDTSTTDTTGGTSPLTIAIVDAYLYSDCNGMGDSTHGDWYVEFDNTANPAATSAILVSASLSLLVADPPMPEPITVEPIASGPIAAGEYLSQGMTKLPGLAHSACEHCGEFYLLELTYDEGGVTHIVDEEVTIQCGR